MLQGKRKSANINTLQGKLSGKVKRNVNLEADMTYHFSRLEKKIAVAKEDILKFFIKSFLAQTSILICLVFALIDFLLKK